MYKDIIIKDNFKTSVYTDLHYPIYRISIENFSEIPIGTVIDRV